MKVTRRGNFNESESIGPAVGDDVALAGRRRALRPLAQTPSRQFGQLFLTTGRFRAGGRLRTPFRFVLPGASEAEP